MGLNIFFLLANPQLVSLPISYAALTLSSRYFFALSIIKQPQLLFKLKFKDILVGGYFSNAFNYLSFS